MANFNVSPGTLITGGSAVIASGQTSSPSIAQNGMALCGIQIPAAFTGTAISFQGSVDNVNFFDVYNAAGKVTYTVAPSRYQAINSVDLQGIQYLKIVSGSTEAASRTLIYSLKGI